MQYYSTHISLHESDQTELFIPGVLHAHMSISSFDELSQTLYYAVILVLVVASLP